MGPAVTTGPGVWGQSPFGPRTGLGALTYAMKHVGHVGRPVGGSGAVPASVRSAFEAAGGEVRAEHASSRSSARRPRVRGVELDDGTVLEAPLVVSACDPRETFVRWLRDPPAAAGPLVERWRTKPVEEGYESKIDAVITELPRFRSVNRRQFEQLGVEEPTVGTTIVVAHARRHRRRASPDRSRVGGRQADVLRQHPVGARPVDARRRRQARPQRRDAVHAVLIRRRVGRIGGAAAVAARARARCSSDGFLEHASSGGE